MSFLDGGIGAHEFTRAMREANGGRPVGYDRPLMLRTVVFRWSLALTALGILLLLVVPSASGIRSSLHYRVEGIFRSTYVPVRLADAYTDPSQPFPRGFGSVGISAERLQGPWAVRWDTLPNGPPMEGPCQTIATRALGNLQVDFVGTTSVDRLIVQAGIDHTNPQWVQVERPAVVDLLFSNKQCVRVHLADQFTPQQFDMHVGPVTGVAVIIVEGYGQFINNTVAVITSLDFLRRR
jgi:hypothetical protein